MFGFHVTASGTSFSASAGAETQVQLWYYVGSPSAFAWELDQIAGTTVNRFVTGAPIEFVFGQPFDLVGGVTARVDSFCATTSVCASWTASGISDVSHTLDLIFDSSV